MKMVLCELNSTLHAVHVVDFDTPKAGGAPGSTGELWNSSLLAPFFWNRSNTAAGFQRGRLTSWSSEKPVVSWESEKAMLSVWCFLAGEVV
eukprot:CAMPEP_0181176206 /NCGR_PEP_ID=MMETSP1096-20121128/4503_1 /TAXON_ID=156174 ORGANISM="Chrysochromulina ericina, Strain CCMP281" /NCGR_SAMPLE_ID=MMETSP1096 /ASSEMBLY_ACC=CAM_ASM_000453 /LENGTH=90 /DNA_ID=CAMNT_0023264273 /DNA_START=654 /DNA_END=922 /DNA_ORIENTATION=-